MENREVDWSRFEAHTLDTAELNTMLAVVASLAKSGAYEQALDEFRTATRENQRLYIRLCEWDREFDAFMFRIARLSWHKDLPDEDKVRLEGKVAEFSARLQKEVDHCVQADAVASNAKFFGLN